MPVEGALADSRRGEVSGGAAMIASLGIDAMGMMRAMRANVYHVAWGQGQRQLHRERRMPRIRERFRVLFRLDAGGCAKIGYRGVSRRQETSSDVL